MKQNKLLKSGLAYTIGNLLIQGLAFITLPLYTRIMSVDDYGSYNLYASWVALFSIFLGLQVSGSYSIAQLKYKEKFNEYVATATSLSTVFFIVFLILSIVFSNIFGNILGFSFGIILFILFQGFFSHIQASFSQYFIQRQESMKQLSLSMSMALSNLILSVIFLYTFTDGFFARILGGFIPYVVLSIVFFIYIYKKSSVILDKRYIYFILITSIPLIFHNLGHSLLNQLDRIMIGKFMSISDVALYSFGYSIGLIIQIVLFSMNTAWVPWFFEEKKKGNTELVGKYKKRYIVIGIFLTIGYLSVFPELVYIMGSSTYRESKFFIVWIIISYFIAFLYTFPVNIQFYHENTRFIPVGTLLSAVINYVLNLYLIPNYGIQGAAVSTLISYLLLLIFHHSISKIKYNYNELKVIDYILYISIVSFYGVFTNYFIDDLIIRWLACFAVFLILIYYYRVDLLELLNLIRKKDRR